MARAISYETLLEGEHTATTWEAEDVLRPRWSFMPYNDELDDEDNWRMEQREEQEERADNNTVRTAAMNLSVCRRLRGPWSHDARALWPLVT